MLSGDLSKNITEDVTTDTAVNESDIKRNGSLKEVGEDEKKHINGTETNETDLKTVSPTQEGKDESTSTKSMVIENNNTALAQKPSLKDELKDLSSNETENDITTLMTTQGDTKLIINK